MRLADEKFAAVGANAPDGRGAHAPSAIEGACLWTHQKNG